MRKTIPKHLISKEKIALYSACSEVFLYSDDKKSTPASYLNIFQKHGMLLTERTDKRTLDDQVREITVIISLHGTLYYDDEINRTFIFQAQIHLLVCCHYYDNT